MHNPLCTQTVTIYSRTPQGVTRQVVSGCHYQWQKTVDADGLEQTAFLLVLPGTVTINPGDRVLEGIGPERVVWEHFLPVNTYGLAQAAYVTPYYFQNRLHHIEAGRK